MKKILKIVPFLAVAILVGVTVAYAEPSGSLTPPAGTPSKTMKTISDLYQLINTGANTPSTDFSTPGTVATNMQTIGDTYDLLTSKIASIDRATILTGTTIFGKAGTASAGASAPTWSAADVTSYDCSWFTTMQDNTQSPSPASSDICNDNPGCSWGTDTCTGGTVTSLSLGGGAEDPLYMTWYAGEAACANSTEGGQTAGTWRLPASLELAKLYLDSHGTPTNPLFQSYSYWSDITNPARADFAYDVSMVSGGVGYDGKDRATVLVRCAR